MELFTRTEIEAEIHKVEGVVVKMPARCNFFTKTYTDFYNGERIEDSATVDDLKEKIRVYMTECGREFTIN